MKKIINVIFWDIIGGMLLYILDQMQYLFYIRDGATWVVNMIPYIGALLAFIITVFHKKTVGQSVLSIIIQLFSFVAFFTMGTPIVRWIKEIVFDIEFNSMVENTSGLLTLYFLMCTIIAWISAICFKMNSNTGSSTGDG